MVLSVLCKNFLLPCYLSRQLDIAELLSVVDAASPNGNCFVWCCPSLKLKAKAMDSYIACLVRKPDEPRFTVIGIGS